MNDFADLWTVLRDEITSFRNAHYEVAAGLEGEGKDGSAAFARADELGKVLDLMTHMEDGQ